MTGANNQVPASATTALRKLPKLKEASKDTLIQIISAMTPHKADKGTPIFLESDPGDSVFLLAEGCVDVMRNVRGGKAEQGPAETSSFPTLHPAVTQKHIGTHRRTEHIWMATVG